VRVPAEDRRQVQTEINGRRYTARDGFFEMPERDARIHLKSADMPGSWQVRGVPEPSRGYRCPGCGFGSFFVRCSRCGGTCTREAADASAHPQGHAAGA
jgi:hypothetical protein